MKQNIVEVIVRLIEIASNYRYDSGSIVKNHDSIRLQLEDAGFSRDLIMGAFDWLKELIEQQLWYASSHREILSQDGVVTFRVFDFEERVRFSPEIRDFLLTLEQQRVLDTKTREIVINQLKQLNTRFSSLEDAKWVVLLVLMSKFNTSLSDIRNYLMTTMILDG